MKTTLLVAGLLAMLVGCEPEAPWKEKFVQEVNHHYATQQNLNAEVKVRDLEIENQKSFIANMIDKYDVLNAEAQSQKKQIAASNIKIASLDTERSVGLARIGDLVTQVQRMIAEMKALTDKLAELEKRIEEKQ